MIIVLFFFQDNTSLLDYVFSSKLIFKHFSKINKFAKYFLYLLEKSDFPLDAHSLSLKTG